MWQRLNNRTSGTPPNTNTTGVIRSANTVNNNSTSNIALAARGSRYSVPFDDFNAENSFSSPVQSNRLGGSRSQHNSANQRYSVLGNLQRRTRVDNNNESNDSLGVGGEQVSEGGDNIQVDHSTALAQDFSKFLFQE